MINFPTNLRRMQVVRNAEGRYEASMQTDEMEGYHCATADRPGDALAELFTTRATFGVLFDD